MESFVTAQRNVDTSQPSLQSENLRRPKGFKSNWTVKATWRTAFCGEGELAVSNWNVSSAGETVKCGNGGETGQETYQDKTALFSQQRSGILKVT